MRTNSMDSSNTSEGSELRDERALNGYASSMPPPPPGFVQSPTGYPIAGALEKHKRQTRSHSTRDKRGRDTRDLARLFVSQERDAKETLQTLHQTSRLLEQEIERANDAENRLAEAQERWKAVNATRITAQKEVSKLQSELSQYKLRFDAAQNQIAQANEMILQSEKERHAAEDAAEKARGVARRYHEERLTQNAREEGRKQGREEGRREGFEVGRRQGIEQAFEEALQQAYAQTRKEAFDRMDEYLASQGLPPVDRPDQGEEGDNFAPPDRTDEPPENMPPDETLSPLEFDDSRQESRFPPPARSAAEHRFQQAAPPTRNPAPPRRNNSFFSRFKRSNNNSRRNYNPNVEVNENAPDVAPIVDSLPHQSMSTPLPPSRTTQHGRSNSVPPAMQMPEPDFNADPRDLRPIPVQNRSPSIRHEHVDLPPDGFVPILDRDGKIVLPPAHELSRTPSPPGQSAVRNSFAAAAAELSVPPPPPPKSPRIRDFGYDRGPGTSASARSRSPHRYQQSLTESIPSTVTSTYDLVSNPIANGRSRTPVLSAIAEHDSRQPSPASMGRRQSSITSPVIPDFSPHVPSNERFSVRRGSEDDYGQTPRRSRLSNQMLADELRYGGPPDETRQQNDPAFSPRSNNSYTSGPRPPPQMVMPHPLSPMPPGMEYTRPTVNSVGSDHASDLRSPRSVRSGRTATTGGKRGHRREPSTNGSIPEITIEPPSRPDSHASQTTRPSLSPNLSSNAPPLPTYSNDFNRMQQGSPVIPPGAPMPVYIGRSTPEGLPVTELPPGFIPTSMTPAPVVGELPPGFVAQAPVMNRSATPLAGGGLSHGFIPQAVIPEPAGSFGGLSRNNSRGMPPTRNQMSRRSNEGGWNLDNDEEEDGRRTPTLANPLPTSISRSGSLASRKNLRMSSSRSSSVMKGGAPPLPMSPRPQRQSLNDGGFSSPGMNTGNSMPGGFPSEFGAPRPDMSQGFAGPPPPQSPRPTLGSRNSSNSVDFGGAPRPRSPRPNVHATGEAARYYGAFPVPPPVRVVSPRPTAGRPSGFSSPGDIAGSGPEPVIPDLSMNVGGPRSVSPRPVGFDTSREGSVRFFGGDGFDPSPNGARTRGAPAPTHRLDGWKSPKIRSRRDDPPPIPFDTHTDRTERTAGMPSAGRHRPMSPRVAPSLASGDAAHATPLPRPERFSMYGGYGGGRDPTSTPLPVNVAPSDGRTSAYGSEFMGGRSPRPGEGEEFAPVIPHRSPYGQTRPMDRPQRDSLYTLTTTPGRPYDSAPLYARPSSAASSASNNSPIRLRRAPNQDSVDDEASIQESRRYPRTPRHRPASSIGGSRAGSDDGRDEMLSPRSQSEAIPIPPYGFTDRNSAALRRQDSRLSIGSNKSYQHFDPSETGAIDLAYLASGPSRLSFAGDDDGPGSRRNSGNWS